MENTNQDSVFSIDTLFATKEEAILQSNAFINALASEINQLILTNFEKLVQLLYRIDVSETKLKALLKENPDKDAGLLIAVLMIERQLQKIKRQPTNENDIHCNEEKW